MLKQCQMICEILGISLTKTDFPTAFLISNEGEYCQVIIKKKGVPTERLKINYEKCDEENIFQSLYDEIMNQLEEYYPEKYCSRDMWYRYKVGIIMADGIIVEFECTEICDITWWQSLNKS